MRKLFSLLFCIGIIFLISLIFSFIPIEFVGNKIINISKKKNISLTAYGNWNFNIIGFKATTKKFEYSFKKDVYEIRGRGEGLIYSFFNDDVDVDNLVLDIHLTKDEKLSDFFEKLIDELKTIEYSLSVKQLFINIYTKNEKWQDILTDELLLSNVLFKSEKSIVKYMATIGINKDKKVDFLFEFDEVSKDRYEIEAELKCDDFHCYYYDNNSGGKVNCSAKNLISTLQDFGVEKITDGYYQKILNKKLSFYGDILNQNKRVLEGKFYVNDDLGKVSFDFFNRVLEISFNSINLDKISDDYKEKNIDESNLLKMEQIMAMSGKENKVLSKTQKKEALENTNSLSKITNFIFGLSNLLKIKATFKSDNLLVNDILVKDLNVDISKEENDKININSITANFGSNEQEISDLLEIQYKDGKVGNISIIGNDVNNFIKILGINLLSPLLHSNKYYLNGNLKLTTNSYFLSDVCLYVDGEKIFDFNTKNVYSFEKKNNLLESKFIVQNIDLDKYFSINSIYNNYYNKFLEFQKSDKQDAIFWKKLFEKRNSVSDNNDSEKSVYLFKNVVFSNQNIDTLLLDYADNNKYTKIDFGMNSPFLDGSFSFDIRNIDLKETISSKFVAKKINANLLENINDSFKKATGKDIKDVLLKDEDYNIPSFSGLNGEIDVKIDNFFINSKHFKNINSSFLIKDGIFESEVFNFLYGDGAIEANIILSLQGQPELKIGFACSGIKLNDIADMPIKGILSLQAEIKAFGFNPVKFFNNANMKGRFILQNLSIPHFDLLNTSNNIITNGIKKDINYMNIIDSKPLYFAKSGGNLSYEEGILNGDIKMSRELVSGACEFEYIPETKIIRKLAGSFVAMVVREKFDEPFPIYIPFACNNEIVLPKCLVDWKHLQDVIGD